MAHQHLHKRDLVTTTVWEDVTETVNVIVTVYGPAPGDASAPATTSTQTTPAQLPVEQEKAADVVVPPSITPSVTPPASVTPPSQAPAVAPQVQAAAPQAQAAAPQAQAAAPQAQALQQPAAGDSSSGGSSGGSQPSGGACGTTGGKCTAEKMTIYNDQGLGACGWTNDTNSQDFFALAEGTFGTYTNDAPQNHKNAFCGRMATISFNGKQTPAMLTDKCPGCQGTWAIDLSQSLWNKVTGSKPIGFESNVEWWFTEDAIYHGPGN
ncbi:MAG: hypothetical protein OHK93_006571 [Ramalina farinacea]|uniref:Uncharacterized protein n=1 Tax=Ramalina farinacea TaxID=258253 RepID=A0AA43QIU9_9LECA|nr:hypothetical protein [Ramalina farinacea]